MHQSPTPCWPSPGLTNPVELTAHTAGFPEVRGVIDCGPQLTGIVRPTISGAESRLATEFQKCCRFALAIPRKCRKSGTNCCDILRRSQVGRNQRPTDGHMYIRESCWPSLQRPGCAGTYAATTAAIVRRFQGVAPEPRFPSFPPQPDSNCREAPHHPKKPVVTSPAG